VGFVENLLRNQIVFIPWSVVVYYFGRGYDISPQIPSTPEILLHFFVMFGGYELGFYWGHRLLHYNRWVCVTDKKSNEI
jgi:sterol desaturase/sphingolipid hydroxylase (fatty acid hydroxylase superfamily)